jgi:protein-disulfide isomerase
MLRPALAPLALAVLVVAGCGQKGEAPVAKADSVAAVAAPAGTVWSDHVVATESGIRMGNPDAAIKIVEYGSYTCPHCKDFSTESHEPLVKNYVDTGKISFEFRNLIRDAVDLTVAIVARCAGPEPFFALSAQLFENQDAMIEHIRSNPESAFNEAIGAPPTERFVRIAQLADLIEFAKQRGVPEDKVRACLADPKAAEALTKHSDEVLKEYPDFPGTPSFLLNGTLLDSTASWSALQAKLRDAGA